MIDAIIPTYNRAASIRKVIGSYLEQAQLGTIIIVDDCSTDDIGAFAAELAAKYPDTIVYHRLGTKMSLPYVRNVGISLSKNEHIFMGEDDVILPPDHFQVLLEKMHEHKASIIAGRRIYLYEGETLDEARARADKDRGPIFIRMPFEGYFERYVDHARQVPFIHSNSLMERSLFDTVHYDPWYAGNGFREELDFYLRAHDAGFSIWLIPDTLSYHLKNTAANAKGGSRKQRIVYEFQVWKNTFRCFWKNRRIFKKEFHVEHIVPFTLGCLVARYSYGFKRRIERFSQTHAKA